MKFNRYQTKEVEREILLGYTLFGFCIVGKLKEEGEPPMEKDSKIAGKIKAQITRFSHWLTEGFKRPDRKWIREILYGIQASQEVKLSDISRSLGEEISLIKTETRLSRNIAKSDLTEALNTRLIQGGKTRMGEDTVLAVDIGDINKPYAKKMEYLAEVRDGSTGESRSPGYWTLEVIAAQVEGEELVPLYGELYSQKARDFASENHQILKAMDAVAPQVGNRGIWAMDRGGDRGRLLEALLFRKLRFVIRLRGDRHLEWKGARRAAQVIAEGCPCAQERTIQLEKEGIRQTKRLTLGSQPVYLPGHLEPLTLVVVRGYGESPLLLLTNLEIADESGRDRILEIYLTRWKCEESYRFMKQAYHLEDIRLLSYTGLRNMIALVQAVFYFVSVELGRKLKLNLLLKKIYERAKRFFEIPDFKQYAIADGIYRILFGHRAGLKEEPPRPIGQLLFPFARLL